jgi:hypothetical protein
MITSEESVVIEEIEIEKPSNRGWLVLGALAIVIALVFGVRAARKGKATDAETIAAPAEAQPA